MVQGALAKCCAGPGLVTVPPPRRMVRSTLHYGSKTWQCSWARREVLEQRHVGAAVARSRKVAADVERSRVDRLPLMAPAPSSDSSAAVAKTVCA
jgi:hypothetical protein